MEEKKKKLKLKTIPISNGDNVMNEIRYRCDRCVVIRTQNAMNHIHSLFHFGTYQKKK